MATIRRRAQRLAQDGELDKALAEYSKVVESGEMDPYDYVFLGDLHLRRSENIKAVDRYEEAASQYETSGLNKNAIALLKKVIRLRGDRTAALRRLADLYAAEGLVTESVTYYFAYLTKSTSGKEIPDGGLECLSRVLESIPRQPDIIQRTVDFFRKFGLEKEGAPLLLQLSDQLERRDALETSSWVRSLALEFDPEVLSHAAEAERAEFSEAISPSFAGPGGIADAADTGYGFTLSAIDEVVRNRDAETSAPGATGLVVESGMLPAPVPADPGPVPVSKKPRAGSNDDDGFRDWRDRVGRADFLLAQGKTDWAAEEYIGSAHEAFRSGETDAAAAIFAKVVRFQPDHPEALRGVLIVSEARGDTREIVAAALRLGEVLLATERFAEALAVYENVLKIDPRNERARMRVGRLRTIVPAEGEVAPQKAVRDNRRVTVREEVQEQPPAFDVGSILSEFKTGISSSISEDDSQSRYDLGVSYMEMDLFTEAIEEFRIASRNPAVQIRAFEMLGTCHLKMGNPDEAVKTFTWALSLAEDEPAEQARLAYALGVALEESGNVEEALQNYQRAFGLDPELVAARERLDALRPGTGGAAR